MDWIEKVREWQDIFEPKDLPTYDLINLRAKLVREEMTELWDGMNAIQVGIEKNDEELIQAGRVETLDAIADGIYVLIGTANALKMDLDMAMFRVCQSNMSKLGADGQPIHNEYGKVVKGPGFTLPYLEDLV